VAKIITKAEFEKEVAQKKGKVVVDFFAPWCGPCQAMSSVIDELTEEVKDAKVFKVNVDEQAELANQFSVMSIPTVILFKDGKPVNQFTGIKTKEELMMEIENIA